MATNRSNNLRIALVHDALTVPGGAEKVLFALHRLFPNAPIYTPLYKPDRFPEFKDAKIITSGLNKFSFFRNRHQLAIPLFPYHIEQFDLSNYDLVISDSTAVAKGVITRPETLHICYCHTPMRWAWMPQLDRRASSSIIRRLSAHYLRIWDSASIHRVDRWIGNSKTSAARIKKFYKQKAAVIYPPVAISGQPTATQPNDFYLTVGRLIPGNYKRTDLIIDAALKTGISLKIVGDGPLLNELKKQIGPAKNIELLGRVSDETRDELYHDCKAFIFAAEEDFGIVPVEAMSFGKPVICYGQGGASETVVHGKTGIHFYEQNVTSIAQAIEQCKTMTFDTEAIMKHAQQFSEEHFTQAIEQFIEDALTDWPHPIQG